MLLMVLISATALFLFFAAFLYFSQERLIFFPTREISATPADVGLSFDDLRIAVSGDERINAWYLRSRDSAVASPATVLYCHGNGGNLSHRVITAEFLTRLGVDVLLFDYRGYGLSDGRPSESNMYADAEAAYRWLVQEKGVAPDRLFLFGRSIGGAVVVDLAGKVPCAGVVVESAMTSAADVGARMYPFMPIRLLIRYRFDALARIGSLRCPVLVTHSPEDEIIPFDMGRALYERAPEPKLFIPLSGRHNERAYYDSDIYINGLREFFGHTQGR